MVKLNYFKLMSEVNADCLSDENFALVCQNYAEEMDIQAAKIIQKKWSQMTGFKIADSLDEYGGNAGSGNLWALYFKTKDNEVYHSAVEDLLLKRMECERDVFNNLSHSLSEESEIKLISVRTGNIVPKLDLQVAATTYAIFDDFMVLVVHANAEYDKQIKIHRHQLDVVFQNLKSYLEKFALSKKALQMLIDITKECQRKQTPYFSYDYLKTAVQTLAVYDDYDALDDEKIQKQLLNITIWNVEQRSVVYPLKRVVLCRYNMYNAPSVSKVEELLKCNDTDFIREVLAHSWLENGKQLVLDKYPEFEAEILLADVAHQACQSNPAEKRYSVSRDYQNLLFGNREKSRRELQPNIPQNELFVLNLCVRMYNTYTDCHFATDERSQIMEEAVHYCQVFGTAALKTYIPQLQEAVKAEKHRVYCL